MKISKIYEELKDVVMGKKNSEKKKAKLDTEIMDKISKVKKNLMKLQTKKKRRNLEQN